MYAAIELATKFIVKVAISGSKPATVTGSYRSYHSYRQRLFKELAHLLEERLTVSLIILNVLTVSKN